MQPVQPNNDNNQHQLTAGSRNIGAATQTTNTTNYYDAAEPNLQQQSPDHLGSAYSTRATQLGSTANPDEYARRPVKQRGAKKSIKPIFDLIALIGGAVAIALIIANFVFQSYSVIGSSMEPTLSTGDQLIIWRAPVTWGKLTGSSYVPTRGSIVIVELPSKDKPLVKRVIGLPGERVVVESGKVTIFNQENPNGFDADQSIGLDGTVAATFGNIDVQVEPDEIFVMGDNRVEGGSLDSRDTSRIGNIKLDEIIGKLSIKIFPISEAEKF